MEISKDQAISIGTKNIPGTITEIELDDDGYYEIEMKISAVDGTILKKEVDGRDDDDQN
ncbi:PepSY domain-containing protein [Fredinandcohnia sp. QZ13]|uniref:PepSY domain-containing protein n=1 Tax=Fredinandcohnia sp. QZ13 TaxID=3073144 RepID=UPI002852FA8C|nr:PepSY domain-containing protein [Fredinandcohnia sp. QZ13]MDR4889516.1 PepSY domain-containing protein [Fredinandcohnia sp. QZ13]